MTESIQFSYLELITGKYGVAPPEQRIHIMDDAELRTYCAWRARNKMVSEYKRYLALNKRAMIVNQNLTRWDMERELFRVYSRYAIKEDDFDQIYDDQMYYCKLDIIDKRNQFNQWMYYLDPRTVKKFDRDLNVISVKTYNFPEHWRACGYKSSFSTMLEAKKHIVSAWYKYKNPTIIY